MFNGDFSHCDHCMALSGVTALLPCMFSGIIEDLVKDIDIEGASMTEKLLQAPVHKFYVNAKDMVYSVTRL